MIIRVYLTCIVVGLVFCFQDAFADHLCQGAVEGGQLSQPFDSKAEALGYRFKWLRPYAGLIELNPEAIEGTIQVTTPRGDQEIKNPAELIQFLKTRPPLVVLKLLLFLDSKRLVEAPLLQSRYQKNEAIAESRKDLSAALYRRWNFFADDQQKRSTVHVVADQAPRYAHFILNPKKIFGMNATPLSWPTSDDEAQQYLTVPESRPLMVSLGLSIENNTKQMDVVVVEQEKMQAADLKVAAFPRDSYELNVISTFVGLGVGGNGTVEIPNVLLQTDISYTAHHLSLVVPPKTEQKEKSRFEFLDEYKNFIFSINSIGELRTFLDTASSEESLKFIRALTGLRAFFSDIGDGRPDYELQKVSKAKADEVLMVVRKIKSQALLDVRDTWYVPLPGLESFFGGATKNISYITVKVDSTKNLEEPGGVEIEIANTPALGAGGSTE